MHTAENKTANTANASNKNALSNAPFFQAKLTINEPGDMYEQEADAMADKVMRMPDNKTAEHPSFFKPAIVQRKENSTQRVEANSETSSYINSLSSKGSSLSKKDRSFFEPRFGHDFSDVKIHNDNEAAKSADSLNALAYTTGNNIVFNQNQFSPGNKSGKKLLAHELTHVVQQKNFSHAKIEKYPSLLKKGKDSPVADLGELEVKAELLDLGGTRSAYDEIDTLIQDQNNFQNLYFNNYRDGLNNFETEMSFASDQETKAEHAISLSSVLKFGFDQVIEAFMSEDPLTKALEVIVKESFEKAYEDFEKREAAQGDVKIKLFIGDLRSTFGPTQASLLDQNKKSRKIYYDEYAKIDKDNPDDGGTGVIFGKQAEYIKKLRAATDAAQKKAEEFTADYFQQQTSEKFSLTGESTAPIVRGGVDSGAMYIHATFTYESEGTYSYSADDIDNQWYLLTNAPKADKLADSLQDSMARRHMKPYQSNLEKNVILTINTEVDWGFDQADNGVIVFSYSPDSYDIRTGDSYKKLNDFWNSGARDIILNITDIDSAETV